MIAGQREEERRRPALEQDPEHARGQGHVGLADPGDAGTRFEHRLEVIGLAVGVEHGDIAALKVQEPLEPPGQFRPHGLGLLGARQPGQHFHQEGVAAGIQPGHPARGAPRRFPIRGGPQHPWPPARWRESRYQCRL